MTYKNIFSQRLSLLRKQKNLSLDKLAKSIGITNQSISQFEKQKSLPKFETLCSLADLFDVSIDYLVGRTDDPNLHKK